MAASPYVIANEEAEQAASAAAPTPRLVRGSEEFRQAEEWDMQMIELRCCVEETLERLHLDPARCPACTQPWVEGQWSPGPPLVRSPGVIMLPIPLPKRKGPGRPRKVLE